MMKGFFYSLFYRGLFFFLLLLAFPFQELQAQAPDSVNYQAVARNDEGDVLGDEVIDVRMSIFQGGTSGNLVYEEEHNGVNTDRLGLFTLYIGGGSKTGGSAASFSDLDWGTGSHHIQVEVDAGSGYEDLGSRKLVSVPYALYSKESGGGGGSLQSAYEGGNEIALDTSPVSIMDGTDTLIHAEGSTVGMGHNRNLQNTKLDVRHNTDLNANSGPGLLSVSAPITLENNVFTGFDEFTNSNTGVFGLGVGTQRTIGVTGFVLANDNINSLFTQDSLYGVTGISVDESGVEASVGVSGISHALSTDAKQAVGVYGRVQGGDSVIYNNNPVLAGGIFEAGVWPDDTGSGGNIVTERTIGVGGRGGWGGEWNFGVVGNGGLWKGNSVGVLGKPGNSDWMNVGVMGVADSIQNAVGIMGIGDSTGATNAYAGWFRDGRTVFEDTIQADYGKPNPGEVLMALDNQGTAVWDTVPSTGTPITLQDAYDNGNNIELNTGDSLKVSDNGGAYTHLYTEDGNPAIGVGNTQPLSSVGGEPISLHVANEGTNSGHLLISSGDNSGGSDAILTFSERISSGIGTEVRYDAIYNQLILGAEVGGTEPMLSVKTGPTTTHGVIIGSNYITPPTPGPPQNGLLVEDTVGVGLTDPAHKFHVEGRSYSSQGFMIPDTAEYRYENPKTRYLGVSGHEFRPTGDLAVSNQLFAVMDHGGAYFETTTDECEASAPLELPDGAEITEMQVYMYDNVSGDSIQFVFEAIPYGGSPTPNQITDVSTSGGGANSPLLSFATPEVIDNQNYMYRLRAIFSGGYGDQLRIENVRVAYEVDKAD